VLYTKNLLFNFLALFKAIVAVFIGSSWAIEIPKVIFI